MTKRLNNIWKNKIKEEIEYYKQKRCNDYTELNYIETDSLCKKFIILILTKNNVPFKVLNMGAGVSKITTETNICSKCKGLGYL